MKRLIVLTFFVLIGSLSASLKSEAVSDNAQRGKLIVHEWGTFTSFAGSDGVPLPFNTLVNSDLPGFVMNRQQFAARRDPEINQIFSFIKAAGQPALVRMETPVVYFYADKPHDVDVHVDFSSGLLTEFYPPIRDMGPHYGLAPGEPNPVAAPTSVAAVAPQTRPAADALASASYLDWGRIRIRPHPTAEEASRIPAIANKSRYAFARQTDSALVEFTDADGSPRAEKFLFYRGLSNLHLPITLVARAGGHFALKNAGMSAIPAAFLLERDSSENAPTRFAEFDDLAGNQDLELPSPRAPLGDLSDAIVKSLRRAGLYEKEAIAMVSTWKDTWLEEPGDRLLYILPRHAADSMLPLRVTSSPDETARVFVGRIDVLTPEKESRLHSMMMAVPAGGDLPIGDVRMLQGLGRFLRPALDRVSRLAGDMDEQNINRLEAALARTPVN